MGSNFQDVEDEVQDSTGGVLMDNPFNPTKISIITKPLTVDLIIKRLASNEIDLMPAFQRQKDLWSETQQSLLIESLLIQFPLPAFYFDATDDNKWIVVDGLQRLCAFNNFAVLKTLRLKNLEFLTKLEGKRFDELERNLIRRIEESQITVYLINKGTPGAVKYNLFKRLNTNGLTLNPQEIRYAINQGLPTKFVDELACMKEFKDATGGVNPDRMLDREFITRFITFFISPVSEYQPDLDTYMNEKMKALNSLSENQRKEILDNFTASMKLAHEVFGKYAFRKIFEKKGKKSFLNKALFEVWAVEFANLTDFERNKLREKREALLDAFISLMNTDNEFVDSISTGTGKKVKITTRFSRIHTLIQEVLAL